MTQELINVLSEKYSKVFGQTREFVEAETVLHDAIASCGNADILINAVTAETDLAFQYGFYATVELLTGGVQ